MAVRSINYEVYTLQGSRWNLHGNFEGNQRERALDEAKTAEKLPNVDGTVVVGESFSSTDNESTEAIIYHTPSMKNKPHIGMISGGPSAPAPSQRKAASKAAPAKTAAPQSAAPKKAAKEKMPPLRDAPKAQEKVNESEDINVVQMLIAFLFASVSGAALATGVYAVMRFTGIFLGRNATLGILVVVFVSTFLALFVPKLKKILASSTIKQSTPAKRERPISMPSAGSMSRPPPPVKEKSSPQNNPDSTSPDTVRKGATEANPNGKGDDGSGNAAIKDTAGKNDISRSQSAASDLSRKAGLSKQDSLDACNAALAKIVQDGVAIAGEPVKSDAYMRFGMILYMAGASEELMHIHNLDKENGLELLIANVGKLGLPIEQAKGFCANVDEYLLDENYFDMYALGRNNQIKLAANPGGKGNLEEAIQSWRFPDMKKRKSEDNPIEVSATSAAATAEPERKFVAVLFTDIVSSTLNQQTKGEEWMMQVIRAHNDIIREAINRYAGHEIKHTGDGIMASFPAVVNSVEAGLAMQRGVQAFSVAMETMAFQIRIGISAGEPIHENGDLFGTPVNMAARILDKAASEQVAVSGIVMEMCRGKPFVFESAGDFEFKGFEDAQTIYQVRPTNG